MYKNKSSTRTNLDLEVRKLDSLINKQIIIKDKYKKRKVVDKEEINTLNAKSIQAQKDLYKLYKTLSNKHSKDNISSKFSISRSNNKSSKEEDIV